MMTGAFMDFSLLLYLFRIVVCAPYLMLLVFVALARFCQETINMCLLPFSYMYLRVALGTNFNG